MNPTVTRQLPVRPNLDQLKKQAKELLQAFRSGDPAAVAEFGSRAGEPKLADAQFILARSYGNPSWRRLVLACRMTNALWEDDRDTVRTLIRQNPKLLTENARGTEQCNWGPPMAYVANVGHTEMVAMLREMGAADLQHALSRAVLQGKIETARRLLALGAHLEPGIVMGPCETVNGDGLAFLMDLGAELADAQGDRMAPIALILETYCRNPEGKHRCLAVVAEQGVELPDTPPMALHRGRIDLLEAHLRRDPGLLSRTFSHEEMFPPELGCNADHSLALFGTPLAGATLLHMAVDYDEIEIARWLFEQGVDANVKADVDANGFGGHTPLFGAVVSQSYLCGRQQDGEFARLLLDRGADPNARASLRKRLRFTADETLHEYRDVTPISWGERFHGPRWVNRTAMRMIESRI